MNLLAPVDLGAGRTAEFVYHAGADIPFGVKLSHGDHAILIRWSEWPGNPERPRFTLESLVPLTVTQKVRCPSCGDIGHIRDNVWWEKIDV